MLRKTCFVVLAMKSEVLHVFWQKKSDFVFRYLIPLFEPHTSEYTFFFVGNKIALFWALYHKKKVIFPFSLLKHEALSFIAQKTFWFACCNIGLFSLLLYQKKGFFQYAASHWFSLDFTQTTVLLSFGEVTLFQNRLSEDNLLFCFRNRTTLWTLYITEKMFWFVGNWIGLS